MADSYTYATSPGGLSFLKRSDNATIPLDLANQDYQAFLTWIAEGNAAPAGWTGPTNPTSSSPPTEGTA